MQCISRHVHAGCDRCEAWNGAHPSKGAHGGDRICIDEAQPSGASATSVINDCSLAYMQPIAGFTSVTLGIINRVCNDCLDAVCMYTHSDGNYKGDAVNDAVVMQRPLTIRKGDTNGVPRD